MDTCKVRKPGPVRSRLRGVPPSRSCIPLALGAPVLHRGLTCISSAPLQPPQKPGQFIDEAAFHTSYVADGSSSAQNRRYGSVWWDDAVMNIINDESVVRLALQPRYLPMIVPARPWTRYNDGGHLVLESLMMRGGYSRQGPSVAQMRELIGIQKEMDEVRRGRSAHGGPPFILCACELLHPASQWRTRPVAGSDGAAASQRRGATGARK